MSNVAQKRPFASLIDDEPKRNESTPPPSPPQQASQPVLMTPAEAKWCNQTIKTLKKHKRAIAFLDPVDPIQFNIPDYFDIVKNPMDLGTVEKKLMNEEYPTVEAFKADVQLIFDNCYLYNNAGDPVCLDAKKLEEQYHKLCKKEPSVLAASKTNNQQQYPLPSQQPQFQYDPFPSTATDVTNSVANSTFQTPTSIKLTTTPTTITIPPQPKKASPTIKVKLPSSAHTAPSTFNDEIKTSTESSSLPPKNTTENKAELMPEDQFKRCEAIVKELKKPKYQGLNWPFLNPVDAAAWGATDYYDIIKHPMDMSTYERKLYEFEYTSEDELVDDIRLMFKNCYIYNPPDHLVHGLGKEFEQAFEKQWAKIQARSQSKRNSSSSTQSSKHNVKRRRTSASDASSIAPTSHNGFSEDMDIPPPANHRVDSDVVMRDVNDTNNNNVSTPISVAPTSNNNTPNSGRSTILRLKLSVKPKEEDQPKAKPITKIPGLALSKEPPSSTSNGPKLAIGSKPPSPVKEKKADKTTPTVLQNHDKWMALAKKSSPESSTQAKPQPLQTSLPQHHTTNHVLANVKRKEVISPTGASTATAKPKAAPPPPPAPTFDINDIYNKIHNEKKLKEKQKREEQEKWEKNERLRLEREKAQSEERMRQIREFNQHLQVRRQKDVKERMDRLNAHVIDISKQKMVFAKYEAQCMARDQDWREIYTWQRETIDYRHLPVPGFVKRSPLKIPDIRKRLLSKCVRLENSKTNHLVEEREEDGGSDMDVE